MIKIHDIKVGDTVVAQYEGALKTGQVTAINHDEKQIAVVTDEQEFWYDQADLFPIALDEAALANLKFKKNDAITDGVQYERGPFIIRLLDNDGVKRTDLQYRDEVREINGELTVNELQNHYTQMTNFHLD